jgi:hypothetical protein
LLRTDDSLAQTEETLPATTDIGVSQDVTLTAFQLTEDGVVQAGALIVQHPEGGYMHAGALQTVLGRARRNVSNRNLQDALK